MLAAMSSAEPTQVWYCYRHPDRPSGVRCRRCERPICPDCMITAPVGFQCPSCVKGAPPVRTLRSLRRNPEVTIALVVLNVLVFLPSLNGGGGVGGTGTAADAVSRHLALNGPDVANGEWWRLVTSGFVHYGLLHIGFNMVLLYRLGTMLEPALGRVRFGILYFASLLGGSLGALLLQPDALTAGASGAVFGLMAAAFVGMRGRPGVDPLQSALGGLILINLAFTFLIPGIAIGGHIGGLAVGAVGGAILFRTDGRDARLRAAGAAAVAAIGVAAALAAMAIA